MVTDARYADNVVLKRGAYQELLTGIKHYPIVDIDYMEDWDTDDRTSRQVWSGYTNDSPCIKITYGDPQTTKGNIIFATPLRKQIKDLQKELEQTQNAIAKKEEYLDRLKKIYDMNNEVLLRETRYVQLFEQEYYRNEQELRGTLTSKLSQVLLMISDIAQTKPWTDEQFEDIGEPSLDFHEVYMEINGTAWTTMLLATEEDSEFIYIPVASELVDVSGGTQYWWYNVNSSGGGTWRLVTQSELNQLNNKIYVFTRVTRTQKVQQKLNENLRILAFADYTEIRSAILIPLYRMAYSKYIAAGIRPTEASGYAITDPKGKIVAFYNLVIDLINLLEAYEDQHAFFTVDPANMENLSQADKNKVLTLGSSFQGLAAQVKEYINSVFLQELQTKINTAAEHYNFHYSGGNKANSQYGTDTVEQSKSLMGLKAQIQLIENNIKIAQANIEKVAAGKATVNANGVVTNTSSGIDKRMFGYKYIKIGDHIHFKDTYYYQDVSHTLYGRNQKMSVMEAINNNAELQKSGTFRITMNDSHIYEIPIKGFTEADSDKDIYIKTKKGSGLGTINMKGNIALQGNLVSNTGHIFASAGAVGTATYLAVRGYPVKKIGDLNQQGNAFTSEVFIPGNTGGFWYDAGSNAQKTPLLRTWEITTDKNTVGIGTNRLILIPSTTQATNGKDVTKETYPTPVGLLNNFGTLEARKLPENDNLVPFRCSNLISSGNIIPNTTSNGSSGSNLGTADKKFYTLHVYYAGTSTDPINNAHITNLYATNIKSNLVPDSDNIRDLGADDKRWKTVYGVTGDFTNLTVNGNTINVTNLDSIVNGKSTSAKFWRGDGKWASSLLGDFYAYNMRIFDPNTVINGSTTNAKYGTLSYVQASLTSAQITAINTQITNLTQQNGQLESQKQNALMLYNEAQTQYNIAMSQNDQSQISYWRNRMQQIQAEISSYEAQIADNTNTINSLTAQLNASENDVVKVDKNFKSSATIEGSTIKGSTVQGINVKATKQIDLYANSDRGGANTNHVYIWYNGEDSNKTTYAPKGTVVIGGTANRNLKANKVYNAVFNDYAECRKTINLTPGHVVIDNDDGSLSCSSQRLQPGAQIISDTYGTLMGETEDCKTPLAVAGRVLVYTYQSRENYHAGMAVCSAPNGTVDIMTREEIKEYPDCIIGIVSEIPNYEKWGSDQVNVSGRIWIKVK